MESSGRESIEIIESIVIIRGLLGKGIQLYGPFKTMEEAMEYGSKNFSKDTKEYITMYKEVVTHDGNTTSNETRERRDNNSTDPS